MDLNLVDRWHDATGLYDPIQVLGREIGDPDGGYQTVALQVHKSPPRLGVLVVLRVWPMDQVQVDVLQPKTRK